MALTELDDIVDAYHAVSSQLFDLHIELAEVLAAGITHRADAFAEYAGAGHNITMCREQATQAAHRFDADGVKLRGTIDALTSRRRWLDVKLATLGVRLPDAG